MASCTDKMYLTGNSICSDKPQDLSDNARVFDAYVNSAKFSVTDRFGVPRYTLNGVQDEAFRRASLAISQAGGIETIGIGKVLRVGAFGIGSSTTTYTDFSVANLNQFFGGYQDKTLAGVINGITLSYSSSDWFTQIAAGPSATTPIYFRSKYAGITLSGWHEFLTTTNTRVDSNGFIKKASPIVDLYANHIEHNDQFDEEPIFEKLGVGHYEISGTLGLAKGLEAGDWYIETPKNKDGERYFNTEWQQLEDNTVIIRTYEREAFTEEYERYDENGEVLKDPNGNPLKFYKRHEINGEPTDIIENRFISLRFYEEPKEHEAPEMPEESEEDRKAREEQQVIEAREQEIAELKRNRTLKSNEALVMKGIDESVYLELIEEVKEINYKLKEHD